MSRAKLTPVPFGTRYYFVFTGFLPNDYQTAKSALTEIAETEEAPTVKGRTLRTPKKEEALEALKAAGIRPQSPVFAGAWCGFRSSEAETEAPAMLPRSPETHDSRVPSPASPSPVVETVKPEGKPEVKAAGEAWTVKANSRVSFLLGTTVLTLAQKTAMDAVYKSMNLPSPVTEGTEYNAVAYFPDGFYASPFGPSEEEAVKLAKDALAVKALDRSVAIHAAIAALAAEYAAIVSAVPSLPPLSLPVPTVAEGKPEGKPEGEAVKPVQATVQATGKKGK